MACFGDHDGTRRQKFTFLIGAICALLLLCQPVMAQLATGAALDDSKVTVYDDDPRTTVITRDPYNSPLINYRQWQALAGAPQPFSAQSVMALTAKNAAREGDFMAILVNEALYPSIETDLTRYMQDVADDGFTAVLYTISGGTPASLRVFLNDRYDEGMIGALFVGDLPVAWFEADCFDNPAIDQFPTDLYYMDLDGLWEDMDNNDINDRHEGNVSPEIWIGRLTASPMIYDGADEVSLLHHYFDKNHDFRATALEYPDRVLAYIDDDWARYGYQNQLLSAYCDLTTINNMYQTYCPDYLDRVQTVYESILTCVHSSPWAHAFIRPPTDACNVDFDTIVENDPKAWFYNLFACSNSRYTETDYMGGWYLFSQTAGLIVIGSTKPGSMLNFRQFYTPLGTGKCHGEAFKDWFCAMGDDGFAQTEMCWYYGMTLLGDPTLCLQPARPHILDWSPATNDNSAPTTEGIAVSFDRDLDPASVDDGDIRVFGAYTGEYQGIVTFDAETYNMTFTPSAPFKSGEIVTVFVNDSKVATTGTELYEGIAWSFTLASGGRADSYTYIADTIEAIGLAPQALTAVDIDGDSDIDLVAALSGDDAIAVFLNDGNAGFSAPIVYSSGDGPRALAAADLNGDGAIDIISANAADNSVSIHFNLDNALSPPIFYAVGEEPASLCVTDINRDGVPDVVTANLSGGTISVLMNNGDGSDFARTDYFCGSTPLQVLPVDINNDYIIDIAVLSYSNRIGFYLNNGDAIMTQSTVWTLPGGPNSVALSDINADGWPDLAYTRTASYGIAILTNDGDLTCSIVDDVALPVRPQVMRSGDIDGDGDIDFVVAGETAGTLSVVRNNGNFTMASPLQFQAGCHPTDMLLADFNGDAVLDIATVDSSTGNLTVLTHYVYLCGNANDDDQVNVGDVVFLINYVFKAGPDPFAVDAADANADGELNVGDAVFLINYTFKEGSAPICRAWE